MLQFNKSQATNTNAAYLEIVNTSSGYYDSLLAVYSQSYDNSNGTFAITASSTPTQYTNWLLFTNTGSVVPSPSGQYDIEIYTSTGSIAAATWGAFPLTWTATAQTWGAITSSGVVTLVDLLYSDRAYISGSNESSITQYVSSDENGTYTTYNG